MNENDGELPATFTRQQKRELLLMAEEYRRRKWALRLLGTIATWLGSIILAIEGTQTIITRWWVAK